MRQNIYNIGAEKSFVDELAKRFLAQYAACMEKLADVLFLLPTRRACRDLADAFVRQRGLLPTILPRIEPFADVEDSEIFLSGDTSFFATIQPKIDSDERLFILMRLISQKALSGTKNVSACQAFELAKNLAELIDLVHNYELNFANLADLVPEEYASHWQETLKLLEIITNAWPKILAQQGMVDPCVRHKLLLKAQLQVLQQRQNVEKIVIAGTTAVFPYLQQAVATVLDMPQGEVYIYGLDYNLDDEAFAKIDENHPQFELKKLLDFLHISRNEVQDINAGESTWRSKLVAEFMRPAETSATWLNLAQAPLPKQAFNGIQILNCDDARQQAQAIALIMREVLETPEKTAALVTSDRNLARRVVSELKRWEIDVDDSAGQPLSLTPIGIYLRLIAEAVEQQTQTAYMAILKHPFTACGYDKKEYNLLVRHLELVWRDEEKLSLEVKNFYDTFVARLAPLQHFFSLPEADIGAIFTAHIKVAESLADTALKSGEKIIWQKDAGAAAADFVSAFLRRCATLGRIKVADYAAFLTMLLKEKNVRLRYGMHPRLKILGLIEARLSLFDTVIIGEANEGVWPQLPNADMWMSRPMKRDFGLPAPECMIGVMAADFAHLMCAPNVYITRAKRTDGKPMQKSRWLLRLETVIEANFCTDDAEQKKLYDKKFVSWSKRLAATEQFKMIGAPHPCPPVERRPRVLSASGIEKLLRDPYAVFARYILSLQPLDDLDKEKQASDFGNIMHRILQNYNNSNNRDLKENAEDELLRLGKEEFAHNNLSADKMAFWWPRFEKSIKWYTQMEKQYRSEVNLLHNESEGSYSFSAPAGNFTVTAKADRIDETNDGGLNILDYKTGRKRTVKEMVAGKAPQLPIEGLIAQNGGFEQIPAKKVNSLRYWGFRENEVVADAAESAKAIAKTQEVLRDLVASFDNPKQPYLAKPVASNAPDYSDYDHLSRFLEWSVRDEPEDKNNAN